MSVACSMVTPPASSAFRSMASYTFVLSRRGSAVASTTASMSSVTLSYSVIRLHLQLGGLVQARPGVLREVRRGLALAEAPLFLLVGGELGVDDAVDDPVDVDPVLLAGGDLHGRGAVLAELELDDPARGVPDRAVVLRLQLGERVDEPALEVAGLGGPDRRVDEPLAAAHRVEEELLRGEPAAVGVLHEAVRLRGEEVRPVVRERPVLVAAVDPLAADRLLADGAGHLRQIQHRATRAGARHHDRRVVVAEVLVGDLAGRVAGLAERLHDLHLQRLVRDAG